MIKPGDPQWLFMAEAEGCDDLVNTRTAKLNAVIKNLKAREDQYVTMGEFYELLVAHDLEDLDEHEYKYILAEVEK